MMFIMSGLAVACYFVRYLWSVTAMMENIVRGFVIVALIIMVTLAYAQKHEGCLRGRSLETFQPCGSVDVDM